MGQISNYLNSVNSAISKLESARDAVPSALSDDKESATNLQTRIKNVLSTVQTGYDSMMDEKKGMEENNINWKEDD